MEWNMLPEKLIGSLFIDLQIPLLSSSVRKMFIFRLGNKSSYSSWVSFPRIDISEQLLTITDPVSYAAIGMESGKEVEFKE